MLESAIVSGELAPGTRLRDQDLAEQLGVSRTPVREAMQRLEAEGLVETRPGSSTRVSPLDPDDARNVFPVVAHLHGLAARLAVPRLGPAEMEAMRRHNERVLQAAEEGDRPRMVEADSDFHAVLVAGSGNDVVVELLDRLTPRVRRYEYALYDAATGQTSAHDHDDIVAACEKGDAEAAARLVEMNWLTLGERVIEGVASVAAANGDEE